MIDLSFPKRGRRGGFPTPSIVRTQLPPFNLCVSIDNRITYSKNVVNYKIESYALLVFFKIPRSNPTEKVHLSVSKTERCTFFRASIET